MNAMKLSMNQATCLEKSSLEKDLELCEKYGYDMIEPRTMDGIPNYLKNEEVEIKYFCDIPGKLLYLLKIISFYLN